MKKIVLLITLLVGTLALAADKPVIKIGAVLPISGGVSFVGENARDALLMRMAEIPADSKFNYKLVIEDDGFEPQRTNMAIQKLKNIDKVDILISNWAHGSELALPLLQNSHSSILHLCSDRWALKEPSYPYDFAVGAPVQTNVHKFIAALKALGIHRLGIFQIADQGARTWRTEFYKELKKEPTIQVVEPLSFDQSERDFRVWILRLREAKPDVLLCDSINPCEEIMLRQMKELGYHVPLCSQSAVFLEGSKGYNEGSWFVQPPPPTGPIAEKFQALYHKEALYPVGHYYDMLSMLINACEKLPAGVKPTSKAISDELRKTKDYPGLLGNTSYSPPDHLATSVDYYIIKNGQPQKVSLDELVNFYRKQK
jgi:ABC-type branched-subunit amino acid transport system substrate-binding protein